MAESDSRTPIPVLLVGEGASRVEADLVAGLAATGQAGRFACAAFASPESAANASAGSARLILIALGPTAARILAHPAWAPWEGGIARLARIAMSDAIAMVDRGATAPLETTGRILYPLPPAQAEALPMATIVVAQLLDAEAARAELCAQLETERACVPLAACLDPGKLYSMTLELVLERLGAHRGLALFAPSPAPREAGVVARGFDDATRDRLCRMMLDDKSLEASMAQGEFGVVPWGPLHHVLGHAGLEAPGPLLSIPLRGAERERGHVWILADGRRFGDVELAAARTVMERANAALETAERYHHAKERAFIDDVTGVYNARYLLATADNEIQRAARYGNPLSVLFLDLDRFKQVNDVHGHLVGSDTLRALSRLLSECVRQVDTLARYGGDEFTILLVDTPHEVALRVGERIRSRIESHLFEAGRAGTLRLTISIGVATCPGHGTTRESLLDAADKAMYRAKSDGRNRVCSADELSFSGKRARD